MGECGDDVGPVDCARSGHLLTQLRVGGSLWLTSCFPVFFFFPSLLLLILLYLAMVKMSGPFCIKSICVVMSQHRRDFCQ